LGVDATQAARGLYEAISAGVPAENAISFLATASKTAIAGVTSVDVAVDGLTNTINAFKIPVAEAEQVADKLFQTVVLGKTTFEELSRNLSKASVPAAALGVDLDELLGVIVGITSQGTPTAEAFTQVKATITALLDPSDELKAVYDSLGVASGRVAIQQLGFVETLQAVRTAYDGNDSALVKALRSSEAYNGVLSVTGANLEKVKTATDGVSNSTGAMANAFDVNSNTLENSLNSLRASAVGLVEMIESSFGVFEKFGGLLRDISNGIARVSGGGISDATSLALQASNTGGASGVNIIQTRIAEVEALRKKLEEADAAGEDFLGGGLLSTGVPVKLGLDLANRDLEALKANLAGASEQSISTAAALSELAAVQEQFNAGGIGAAELAERQAEIQGRLNAELETAAKYEAQRIERMGIVEQRKQRELDLTKKATQEVEAKAAAEKEAFTIAEKTAKTALDSLKTEEEALQLELSRVDHARELGLLTEEQAKLRKDQLLEEIRLIQERNAEEMFVGGVLPPKDSDFYSPGNPGYTPSGSSSGGGGGGGRATSVSGGLSSLSGLPELSDPFGGRDAIEELEKQTEAVIESYKKRQTAILELTGITEEQRLALLQDTEDKYKAIMVEADRERAELTLSATSDLFGDIASIGNAFGKKGAKIAKAAAIAKATIDTYSAATGAYTSLASIPYIGPALGAAAAAAAIAAGLANVQRIRSTDEGGGNYATGGIVPGSNFAGDNVRANVNSGEMILNRSQQRNLFEMANGKSNQGGNITIINQASDVATIEPRRNESGDIEFIMKRIAADVRKGGNPLANAIQESFSLSRAR
jgi:TP901 family phage tail tape measure protein